MNCEVDMKMSRSLIARVIRVVTKKTDWWKMIRGIIQIKNCIVNKPHAFILECTACQFVS